MSEPGTAGGAAEAAASLAHDLGKAVRFSAPRALEGDTEALRARLRADVLETRRGPSGRSSAAEVFAGWSAAHGQEVAAVSALREPLGAVATSVERARRLAARLDSASREELEALDAETRTIAEACRRLRDAARANARGPR